MQDSNVREDYESRLQLEGFSENIRVPAKVVFYWLLLFFVTSMPKKIMILISAPL